MSKVRWIGVLLLGLMLPVTAFAQQATITGKVTTQAGQPLSSVSVFIQGLNVGSLTGNDGSYSFVVPAARFTSGQQVQLLAQLIGYRAESHSLRLTASTQVQNFSLGLDPLRLTEIVATGSGTETRRERLGTSVSSVTGATVQRSNEPNMIAALSGKVPNVLTVSAGGDAGASTGIQIRGQKSITGTSQPLIIVDGVPTNNNTRIGATLGGTGLGAPIAPNRAADINPEDIESIEILKGSAATSIYGASAGSAGAILITTKRGKAGRTSYTLRSTYQSDKAVRYLPVQLAYGVGSCTISHGTPASTECTSGLGGSSACFTTNCSIASNFFAWGPKLADGTPTYDHAAEVFEKGKIFDNTLSMSGGNERTSFYLSVGGFNQNGFVVGDQDYWNRYSVRFNGQHSIFDNLTVAAAGSYVQTSGGGHDRGNGLNGIGIGALRQPPEFNAKQYLDSVSGLHRSWRFPNPGPTALTTNRGFDNPFYAINSDRNSAETGRYYGNVNANWKPMTWLQVNYTLGGDYNSDDRTYGLAVSSAGTTGGQLERWQFYDRLIDSNLNATASWQKNDNILGTLTLGQNLNETYFRQVDVTGLTLIAPQPFKLSNTTTRSVPSDSETRRRLEGYFAQATFDLYDQLFLQARIRNDGSSSFGVGHQRRWYPGGSVAWSFTKALHIPESLISFGKARIAYGQSGQQPGSYQQQDVYTAGSFADFSPGSLQVPTLGGQGGVYPSGGRGNPLIAPEKVAETEGGIDLSLFRGKADLSVTRYVDNSTEVIFGVNTPASTGYTSQSLNAGSLSNKGWEVVANYRIMQKKDFSIEIGANWAMNRNKVLSLGGLNIQTCTSATAAECAPGTIQVATFENCGLEGKLPRCVVGVGSSFAGQSTAAQVGLPFGIWRSTDFARCGRGLTTVSFAGTTYDVGSACVGAADGALYIGPDGFPITDPTERAIGNPEPKWTAGLNASLNIKGVEITAFVDHRRGGDMLNMTRSSMYQYGTHKDTEIRGQTRTFGKDMLCHNKTCEVLNGAVVGPGAGTAVVIGEGWFSGGTLGRGQGATGGPATTRIEDGTHTRLREISLGYSFKGPWVQKIGGSRQLDVKVSGRNLRLWTDYSGLDPETNIGGASNSNRGVDWFGTPMDRAFIFSFALHH
ncbi:MAG TPA: SusC/RagA family TonB-linked outer membrane protein [Longimicrobiales bacterium]|nr:SusC/RagA family TonB-linked outer membrane protein [Longimicrobiales bacterium]